VQTIGKPVAAPDRSVKSTGASVAAHLLVVLGVAAALHHAAPWVAPYRLPGTAHGSNFVVAYLPDRAPEQSAASKPKSDPKPADPKSLLPTPKLQPKKTSESASTDTSASPQPYTITGADALGSGNITIALGAYFPTPHPDLSALPRGVKGDVILDVVIDTNGKITELKKASGIGYGIDETVIATVQQWVFHPAMQNGHPVASEQELHFHYERG
jgi:protein TonB